MAKLLSFLVNAADAAVAVIIQLFCNRDRDRHDGNDDDDDDDDANDDDLNDHSRPLL